MRNLLVALALAASSAFAANVTDDAPIAQFKGKDRAMFDAALYGKIDDGKDGAKTTWSNPETKAGGEVRAVKSFQKAGVPCRTVHVANKAAGRTSSANYNFCKSAAGKWVLTQ